VRAGWPLWLLFGQQETLAPQKNPKLTLWTYLRTLAKVKMGGCLSGRSTQTSLFLCTQRFIVLWEYWELGKELRVVHNKSPRMSFHRLRKILFEESLDVLWLHARQLNAAIVAQHRSSLPKYRKVWLADNQITTAIPKLSSFVSTLVNSAKK